KREEGKGAEVGQLGKVARPLLSWAPPPPQNPLSFCDSRLRANLWRRITSPRTGAKRLTNAGIPAPRSIRRTPPARNGRNNGVYNETSPESDRRRRDDDRAHFRACQRIAGLQQRHRRRNSGLSNQAIIYCGGRQLRWSQGC